MKKAPGIFNDVIGPVMRGPSSSHTAASWRIARLCLGILGEPLNKARVEFDRNGAWASNFKEQGTVMGIHGGLLNLEITDPHMKDVIGLAKDRGISILYEVSTFETRHPNTVRLTLEGTKRISLQFMAASFGGGSIEIQQVDGCETSIQGDYFELIVWTKSDIEKISSLLNQGHIQHQKPHKSGKLVFFKSTQVIPENVIKEIKKLPDVEKVVVVYPVLPIVSGRSSELPFNSVKSMLDLAEKQKLGLGDAGILYEQHISGLKKSELLDKMKHLVSIIDNSINTGLQGTNHQDRILHQQSHLIEKAEEKGSIFKGSVVNKIIACVTAIMESKSAMEVIVANPTAGSCGTVGGTIKAIAEKLNSTENQIVQAYFAAGLIGVYFASGPGFSAEEHGCQVECGAASGMAAAAISQLFGGSAEQCIGSASMAIQNMIGLICDPVADRVEVPCLGKNISAAVNALSSATMVCSGYDPVIPFEEVMDTVVRVGNQMPACNKCTGKGGLSITQSSLDLKKGMSSGESSTA